MGLKYQLKQVSNCLFEAVAKTFVTELSSWNLMLEE